MQTSNQKQMNSVIFYPLMAAIVIILTWFDRFTKLLAINHLKGQNPIILIKNVLMLEYLENHGAAFGMLQNQQIFFWILTVVFLGIAVFFFVKVPKTSRYMFLSICVAVLTAGAIGNFIDRISQQYVTDFIYFSLIDFPIFNVADIYVTMSVIFIVIMVVFVYKENEFEFMSFKKK